MYLKKRITMREDGILMQPNATYVPKLVAMMKVSGRRKRGLPYNATPETFNAEFVVESEMLDGEKAGLFRSGLGLTLYMAMDRPDIQFVVKALSSYMSRPSVKALSALKNLVSYLEGTPDDGVLLRSTEEGKMVSDFWKEDDFIQDEVTIPDWTADGRFILEAFSDSSWADWKATRRSTSCQLRVDLSQWIITHKHLPDPSFSGTFQLRGWVVCCQRFDGGDSFLVSLVQVSSWRWNRRKQWQGTIEIVHGLSISIGTYNSFFKICCVRVCLPVSKFTQDWTLVTSTPTDLEVNGDDFLEDWWDFSVQMMRKEIMTQWEESAESINRATREQCVRLIQMANVTLGMCMLHAVEGLQQWGIHPAPRGVAAQTAGYFGSYTLNSSALLWTPRGGGGGGCRRGCRRRRRGRRAHAEPSCAQRKLMSCHVTPSWAHRGLMLCQVVPCWAILGPCSAHVGLCWAHLGPILGPSGVFVGPMLRLCWPMLGLCWPILADVAPMLGLCWPLLGLGLPMWALCWASLRAMLGIGSGYVGDLGPMLVRCWAVYVENIFRDNFLRFFPTLQAKTVEKPTFF